MLWNLNRKITVLLLKLDTTYNSVTSTSVGLKLLSDFKRLEVSDDV